MFAGGGTGGHLYLGIAMARELQKRNPAVEFVFVGTRRGLESRIVPQEGFKVEFIDSAGLKGMRLLALLRNSLMIPKSLLQSRRLVRRFSPDVAVGVGGYSSGPVVLSAALMRIPTLIMEPNAHPGLANRWLSSFVDRVALALPDAGDHFGPKATVTGIPVREEFRLLSPKAHRRGELTLLVYGGSQGSRALNAVVRMSLPELKTFGPALQMIHQTGEREHGDMERAYAEAGISAEVRPFFPRIYEEFAQADILLTRAGAGTVAELTAAGKASILVPFPQAADDHQTKNALALQQFGAARMIREHEWARGRLALEIRHYMEHPEEIQKMEEAAVRLSKPEATRRIADMIEELAIKRPGAARRHASAPRARRS